MELFEEKLSFVARTINFHSFHSLACNVDKSLFKLCAVMVREKKIVCTHTNNNANKRTIMKWKVGRVRKTKAVFSLPRGGGSPTTQYYAFGEREVRRKSTERTKKWAAEKCKQRSKKFIVCLSHQNSSVSALPFFVVRPPQSSRWSVDLLSTNNNNKLTDFSVSLHHSSSY